VTPGKPSRRALAQSIMPVTVPMCAFAQPSWGAQCSYYARWKITRYNGSTYDLCTRHYNMITKQHAEYPGMFSPVTVQRIK